MTDGRERRYIFVAGKACPWRMLGALRLEQQMEFRLAAAIWLARGKHLCIRTEVATGRLATFEGLPSRALRAMLTVRVPAPRFQGDIDTEGMLPQPQTFFTASGALILHKSIRSPSELSKLRL